MHFSLPLISVFALLLHGAPAVPAELEARACSISNSGTHCQTSDQSSDRNARDALADLLSQCQNGNLPGNAKRTSSRSYNGVIAYACNGFCRTQYMPCQDAEWSINRVINGCNFGRGMGWDSQETRGTWYGIAHEWDKPCGFAWNGRGSDY